MSSWRMAFAFCFAAVTASAQVADMSGKWQLNVQKSSWGKHPKPTAGTVLIEHHEPVFKYSGMVEVDNGTETTDGKKSFSFDGSIDGKEYPVSGTAAAEKMTIRRVSPTTTISELKSGDGTVVETAKTTISADGKHLTRDVKAVSNGKEISWTEVYDRR
jgi:hypothetical protein